MVVVVFHLIPISLVISPLINYTYRLDCPSRGTNSVLLCGYPFTSFYTTSTNSVSLVRLCLVVGK